jgi:hypothetical protein
LGLLVVVLVASIVMVRRNLALGRTDRRGAFRMALFVFLSTLAAWAGRAHHVASLEEGGILSEAIKDALLVAGIVWLVYLALEPYVRRFWPEVLISWSRILSGRARDPLVGRDLLYGAVAGAGGALLITIMQLLPQWVGGPAIAPAMSLFGFAFDWPLSLATAFALMWNSMFTRSPCCCCCCCASRAGSGRARRDRGHDDGIAAEPRVPLIWPPPRWLGPVLPDPGAPGCSPRSSPCSSRTCC